MRRRKSKRYRSGRGISGVKFLGIIGIMVVAVICGYLTARFIIAPFLGYDTETLKFNFTSDLVETFRENVSKKDTTEYALQFGAFSSRSNAEKLAGRLKNEGIKARVTKSDDKYKVLSPAIATKDEAVRKLKETETDQVESVFITVVK